MSDPTTCDNCGKIGRRRMATVAPEGWYYAAFQYQDDPDEECIVWACSKQCQVVKWHAGPGKLNLNTGVITHEDETTDE